MRGELVAGLLSCGDGKMTASLGWRDVGREACEGSVPSCFVRWRWPELAECG